MIRHTNIPHSPPYGSKLTGPYTLTVRYTTGRTHTHAQGLSARSAATEYAWLLEHILPGSVVRSIEVTR